MKTICKELKYFNTPNVNELVATAKCTSVIKVRQNNVEKIFISLVLD